MDAQETLNTFFSDEAKKQLVARIHAACRMVREQCLPEFADTPNRAKVYGRTALHFFVDRLLAEAINLGLLPFKITEKKVKANGYWYMEYSSDKVKWQVKRVKRRGQLPKGSSFRVSNSVYNQLFFDFGPEFQFNSEENSLPFAIVTYGHNNFYPQFVMVGFPEPNYREWAATCDITNVSIIDLEERIYEDNAPKLKKEFLQNKVQETLEG